MIDIEIDQAGEGSDPVDRELTLERARQLGLGDSYFEDPGDAVRDADNPWVHRDLDLPTHKVSRLLVANPGAPTHRIGVDEQAHLAGVESLKCHKVYFEALPDHPKPEEFIPEMLAQPDGGYAVSFRVFEQI